MDANENASRARSALSRDRNAADVVIHATAVSWQSRGVLILGASGSGKSGLALRLMALGADLVADDRVLLRRCDQTLIAEAPEPLAGLIEARSVGILRLLAGRPASIAFAVDLDHAPKARMPEQRKITLLGYSIDLIYGCGVPNLDAIITVIAQKGANVI